VTKKRENLGHAGSQIGRLELHDPEWRLLITAYGGGGEAAEELGRMEAAREAGADLRDIASSGEFRRERQPELAADTVQRIAEGYLDGLGRLSRLYGRIVDLAAADLEISRQEGEDADSVYLLAAYAAYAGNHAAARLLFAYPEGDEYMGTCPNCEADWYLWPKEDSPGAYVVYGSDPVTEAQTDASPSAVLPATDSALRRELRTLEREARRCGSLRLAAAIPALDGRTFCPSCGQEGSVWEALQAGLG